MSPSPVEVKITTVILSCMLDFNKVVRKPKKKYLKGKRLILQLFIFKFLHSLVCGTSNVSNIRFIFCRASLLKLKILADESLFRVFSFFIYDSWMKGQRSWERFTFCLDLSADGCRRRFSFLLPSGFQRNLSMRNELNEGGNVANTSDSFLLTRGDDVLPGKQWSLQANEPPLRFPRVCRA